MASRPASPPRRPALGLLPAFLLPLGCAAEGAGTLALREALDSGRASLAAFAPAEAAPAPAPTAMPATAAVPPAPPAAIPAGVGEAPQAAAQFLGTGPAELRRWLGEPQLRRAEGPAEVWLYAAGGCALDIILYREAHGRLHVAHAAARANGTEPRTEASCLREITSPAAAPETVTARRGAGA